MKNSQHLFEHASRLARLGAVHLKAEFEAEGSRREEVTSLQASTRRGNLGLTLKIGGCEAITDLRDAIEFQADVVVAPMVESTYALSKFDSAIGAHGNVLEQHTEFMINIETISALNNIEQLADAAAESDYISGLVFGRVDFVSSIGKNRSAVDSEECLQAVIRVAEVARERNLNFVVGGAISDTSEAFLGEVAKIRLSRFETRKVVFDAGSLTKNSLRSLLIAALGFELDWLKAKRSYYHAIAVEDEKRISMLENRLALSENP